MIQDQSGDNTQIFVEIKRKSRRSKTANYFDVAEERAVKLFLLGDSWEEKNKIYNQYLRKPLDKMISSIIRRYKLYRKDMDFKEIHSDTHSFLMTKIEKFDPTIDKKAYSYFGTICKNYLMGQIIKDQKETNRKISYEDISSSLEDDMRFSYMMDDEHLDSSSIISLLTEELKSFIELENLNDNEKKLGFALIDLFENYNTIFIGANNNKFNKNIVLLSLREMTNLTTKEIRISMRKYKKLYGAIINLILKE